MAGIAGIVYPDAFQMNQLINPMLSTISHRCNQKCDVYRFKNVELGVCGRAFYFSEKKDVVIGFDGVIENCAHLSKDLQIHGYDCSEKNYAELLIKAYEVWGTQCFNRIEGDFAMMVFDTRKKKLFLARDRIGKKPLYWFQDQNHFIFGSELKSLLATGCIPQTAAPDAFSSYLYFGFVAQDMTPIQGINKLLPAYYLQLNHDKSMSVEPYWSYSSQFERRLSPKPAVIVEHLNQMLNDVVKNEIPGKESCESQNLGCVISGGLGSASVAYYASKNCEPDRLTGFTVGFEGQNEDDIAAAQAVANSLRIQHDCEKITEENFLDNLVRIVWHLDEPIADPNVVATWKIAQLASRKTNILFSGMGCDELLAGHSRYTITEQPQTKMNIFKESVRPYLNSALIPLLRWFYKPAAYALIKQSRTNPWQFDYLRHNAVFNETILAEASPLLAGLFDPEVFLHKFHHLARIKSNVASYLYFDVKTRLPDLYILQYERLLSAHGLTWNTPYLNKQIVEYLASYAEPTILQEHDTAQYLKPILRDIFPESFIFRPKKSRKNFLKAWANQDVLKEAFSTLPKGQLVEAGFISEAWLLNHLETPESRTHSFQYLWSILILEVWYRLFISHPVHASPPETDLLTLLKER